MRNDLSPEGARLLEENARLRKRLAALENWRQGDGSEPRHEPPPDFFEAIFETIPDGVVITRAKDGTIINANRGFERLTGHQKSEMIGKTTQDLHIWSRLDDRERLLADLSRRGSVDDFITPLHRKDGTLVSVLIYATYLTQNSEYFILAVIRNIDQLTTLSRELGVRRARYTDLVELLPAVLFECDEELRITFLNAAGLSVFGEPMTANAPIHLSRLITPGVDVDLGRWMSRASRGKSEARLEVTAHRYDGSSFPALLTVSQTDGRSGTGEYLGVIVDTTDQKLVRDQLVKLSRAVEQSPALVLITDKAGHIEYVNPQFTKLTGFTLEEVIGRTPRILKSGAVREQTYRTMWNTILAGKEWRTEILNRKKNGETYWQRSVVSPIYDEAGNISHFLEVAEDITRERELESELFQSQKMEAIGHLAGGIAHDFNNMLTVIMGVGELLSDRLGDAKELRGYTESILSAARKSAALTHQLLAFSRKQLLQPEKLDLNAIVRDSEKLLQRVVDDNVRIRTDFAEDLGYALLDQSQVNQIILNLVVNAKEAILGSGTITISTAQTETDRELNLTSGRLAPGAYLILSVSDTGAGMDEETRSHIFEPFYTTKNTGTGLGLSTVYGIVQQSKGQIQVKSTPGVGTTFTLYFPAASAEGGRERRRTESAGGQRGTETILVVEDEEQVRAYITEVLTGHGYEVVAAESAETAKGLWQTLPERPDLVVTDVVLPQQDGVHLFRDLSRTQPGLPVLYISGYTDDSSALLTELEEGRFLLTKPFGADQLTAAVRQALDTQTRQVRNSPH